MKKQDIAKIREMSLSEMEKRLEALKKELFTLRFQHAINQLDNPMRMKAVKKEIAIIKTIMREIELGGAEA